MEKTTINTYLYRSTTATGTFSKVVDITKYPKLFSAPEKIDVSDLSGKQKKYEPGMVDVPDLEFGYIYTKAAYDAIKVYEGTTGYYQLRFGENGEYGDLQWSGDCFTTQNEGSTGSAREATLTCYASSEITEAIIST